MMPNLPIFVRLQDRPVILIGDGHAAAAKRRLLERAGARIVDESGQAALAFVALDDKAASTATVARLRARGILVNATDLPADCDFTMPAIVDRSPVLVAVGTGGASAGLAKTLRQRLEALLPAGIGEMAAALGRVRPTLPDHWPEFDDRRQAIDAALSPGGPLDPMDTPSAAAVDAWLAGDKTRTATRGRLETILLVSPDPDDLTLRQARLLGQADHLYHSPDVPAAILARARADAGREPALAPPDAPPSGLCLFVTIGTA